MPFILIIVGAAIMISAFRGQAGALGTQVAKDFTGSGSFLVWIGALFGVGALGYVKVLKPYSDGLMGLILLTFVLKNGGMFSKLQQAFSSGASSLANKPVTSTPSSSSPLGGMGNNTDAESTIASALLGGI